MTLTPELGEKKLTRLRLFRPLKEIAREAKVFHIEYDLSRCKSSFLSNSLA